MPKKPRRPCSYPGCPNLCDGQYCEEHRKQARRQYDKYERSPYVNKKYGRAWKRIRDRYVAEHPLCEMCLEQGKLAHPGGRGASCAARIKRRNPCPRKPDGAVPFVSQ